MKEDLAYGKNLLLFDLAVEMQNNSEGLSLNDIRDMAKCSRRTAERLRDALMRLFPDMAEVETGDRVKRWHISGRAANRFLSLSAEELSLLETAAESLEKQGLGDKAEQMRKTAKKIKSFVSPREQTRIDPDFEAMTNAEGIACRPGPRIKVDQGIIEDLRYAILAPRQVRIVYNLHGKNVPFVLKPYAFLYGERNHYLIAKNDKNAFRSFILTGIKKITVLGKSFERDEKFDLKKYAAKSFGVFQEKPFEVEWRFRPEAAEAARCFLFHPTQKTTDNPDGSLTVAFKAGGILEMAWHAKTWGANLEVVKPADFWERAEQAQKAFEKG